MLVISADPLGNQFVNIAHKIVEALVVHIRIIPIEQRTAGRGAIPVFGTPPLPCPPIRVKWNGLADLEQVGEQAAVYQDWIRRMCGVFGYPLLDLHQKLIRVAAREGRPLSDYFLDGLHMNEEGNRAIAEAAAPALRKIMER